MIDIHSASEFCLHLCSALVRQLAYENTPVQAAQTPGQQVAVMSCLLSWTQQHDNG